jgi:hypothetical protein
LQNGASRFVDVTDEQISEIKINSVPKNTKDLCKNTQTNIRLRLGDYRGIFTSTSGFFIVHAGAKLEGGMGGGCDQPRTQDLSLGKTLAAAGHVAPTFWVLN